MQQQDQAASTATAATAAIVTTTYLVGSHRFATESDALATAKQHVDLSAATLELLAQLEDAIESIDHGWTRKVHCGCYTAIAREANGQAYDIARALVLDLGTTRRAANAVAWATARYRD